MSEFAYSLSAGKSEDGSPLGIGKPLIIWPTVEDVRCSIEVFKILIFFLVYCIMKFMHFDYYGKYEVLLVVVHS
jgi:hypothetical protein